MKRVKYIVFEELYAGNYVSTDYPMLIFPEIFDHSFMASKFKSEVDSAGFIDIKTGKCYGKSVSLGKNSYPERDDKLFESQYVNKGGLF